MKRMFIILGLFLAGAIAGIVTLVMTIDHLDYPRYYANSSLTASEKSLYYLELNNKSYIKDYYKHENTDFVFYMHLGLNPINIKNPKKDTKIAYIFIDSEKDHAVKYYCNGNAIGTLNYINQLKELDPINSYNLASFAIPKCDGKLKMELHEVTATKKFSIFGGYNYDVSVNEDIKDSFEFNSPTDVDFISATPSAKVEKIHAYYSSMVAIGVAIIVGGLSTVIYVRESKKRAKKKSFLLDEFKDEDDQHPRKDDQRHHFE